ncbi:hypothetical protein [Chitinophaga eiseniae]|uniref:Uncharacterized protein n=1 Tax=Chitinophaga eiseniae TaxID=634771 RepID=A0A847SE30_9BACT|nr:hypothetical protein [Chitinophaga eiseniae]NLR78023.1 hypothetical protein [Chitinophaga eiseniae]
MRLPRFIFKNKNVESPVGNWISTKVDLLFIKVAEYLNRKQASLSRRQKIRCLAMFITVFGGMSILSLVQVLIRNTPGIVIKENVDMPLIQDSGIYGSSSSAADSLYIQEYLNLVDSIRRTPNGPDILQKMQDNLFFSK